MYRRPIVPKDQHDFKETSYHMDRYCLLNKINESKGEHMSLKELCMLSQELFQQVQSNELILLLKTSTLLDNYFFIFNTKIPI